MNKLLLVASLGFFTLVTSACSAPQAPEDASAASDEGQKADPYTYVLDGVPSSGEQLKDLVAQRVKLRYVMPSIEGDVTVHVFTSDAGLSAFVAETDSAELSTRGFCVSTRTRTTVYDLPSYNGASQDFLKGTSISDLSAIGGPSPHLFSERVQSSAVALEAAKTQLEAVGFEPTNVRNVAKAAGVATGTVLLHFPNKRDFAFLAWLQGGHPDPQPLFERLLEPPPSPSFPTSPSSTASSTRSLSHVARRLPAGCSTAAVGASFAAGASRGVTLHGGRCARIASPALPPRPRASSAQPIGAGHGRLSTDCGTCRRCSTRSTSSPSCTRSPYVDRGQKPGRDPRDTFEAPTFRDDVRKIEDVKVGMELREA